MAWSNPNPSVKQERNQPLSYPPAGPPADRPVKDWYQAEASAAAGQPGTHRPAPTSKPAG